MPDETPPTFEPATEKALDAAAVVAPEDVNRARLAWEAHAPAPFRPILDAEHSDD